MSKIGLIISREFTQRVRKRSFLVVTLLMPLAMVALVVVPVLLARYGGDDTRREVVVLDASGLVASALAGVERDHVLFLAPEDSTLRDHTAAVAALPDVYGFLEIDSSVVDHPSGVRLYTRSASTAGLEGTVRGAVSEVLRAERVRRTGVEGLDSLIRAVDVTAVIQTFELQTRTDGSGVAGVEKSSAVAMGLAYGAGLLIYMFVLIYGMMVMQGVVEEKTNRIVEVLVSSVRPFELMMGKIVGIALVALLQFGVWLVVIGGLAAWIPSIGAATGLSGVLGSAMVDTGLWIRVAGSFVLFFVGGYLLYAAMFAAIGSAVDNASDTQQLQLPVTMPLIVAIVLMMSVMQDPNSSLAFWGSMIPLTSPIIMMARVAYGVPLWEFLLSLGLLYGSFVGMTWVAAKIYRTGILMYGKKVSLGEMLRWIRIK